MEHTLPPLPYAQDALAPHLSKETLEYHYGKHHNAYVTNLNNLQKGTEFENLSPGRDHQEVVRRHLQQLGPGLEPHLLLELHEARTAAASPTGALADAINAKFGCFAKFKEAFTKTAVGNFGSGWTWLVKKPTARVDIVNTGAAGTPLTTADKPLLTIDVWEHAYYIDYRNLRPKFVETFLTSLVNWDFAERTSPRCALPVGWRLLRPRGDPGSAGGAGPRGWLEGRFARWVQKGRSSRPAFLFLACASRCGQGLKGGR